MGIGMMESNRKSKIKIGKGRDWLDMKVDLKVYNFKIRV